MRIKKISIKWLWPVKVTLEIIKRRLLIFCWSYDESPLKWNKKILPSLQFVFTNLLSLLSPLNSNDRSIPLSLNWESCRFTVPPEGVCTDEFLSRKPGFLLSAMHSHAFRWFSAAPWFSCSLVFFPYSCIRFGGFFVKNVVDFICLIAKTISHWHVWMAS